MKQQQAPQTKSTAPGKTRHVAHAKGWKAICTAPDFCKVGKDIIAFDSFTGSVWRSTPLLFLGC